MAAHAGDNDNDSINDNDTDIDNDNPVVVLVIVVSVPLERGQTTPGTWSRVPRFGPTPPGNVVRGCQERG